MKAMVLAAGLGTRLQPLSKERPKPILPILGKPIVEYTLEHLKKAGVKEVILNLHHHPHAIEKSLGDGKKFGLKLSYSYEPQILGSGGGLKKVESFLSGGTFFLINSDMLIDIDLKKVFQFHRRKKAFATMVLREDPNVEQYGAIAIDRNHRIKQFLGKPDLKNGKLKKLMFTGVHVLEPEIFDHIPEGVFSNINRVSYPKLHTQKRIFGYPQKGYWRECGTPLDYFHTAMELLNQNGHKKPRKFPQCQFIPPVWIGKNCTFGKKSVVGPNVILGEGARVGAGAEISDSILWDQVRIKPNEIISHAIIGKKEKVQLRK